MTLYESGKIAEYLCDIYDQQHRFLAPVGIPKHYEELIWVHASEGTYITHGLAVTYVRWSQKSGNVKRRKKRLGKNVHKDLDYFEAQLKKSFGRFLLGDQVTVADIFMHYSLSFILARKLGTRGKSWPEVEQYIRDYEATDSFQRAAKKTGYRL